MGLEMTDLTTDLRLGMTCTDLIEFFLGGLCRKKGKENLGSVMRHSFCRVMIGARKEIILML